MLATAGILLVATLLPQFDPDLNIVMKDRTLDAALSALTAVVVTGLAMLSFMRYRETGRLQPTCNRWRMCSGRCSRR